MSGALVHSGSYPLFENCVPGGGGAAAAGVRQAQLYALCDGFDPEFLLIVLVQIW